MKQATRCVLGVVILLLWCAGSPSAEELFSPTQDPIAGSRVFRVKEMANLVAYLEALRRS